MEIRYDVIIIILSILDCRLCCRSSQNAKPKEISSGDKKNILNVKVTSKLHDEYNCNVGESGSSTGQKYGADDINLCYDQNEEVEIICNGDNLPPNNYLIWHQHTTDNITFSTQPLTRESTAYSLRLHMDRIDNGSYVYCTLRYENKDIAISKNINLLLNSASALSDFGNFIPEYYSDTDAIKPFQCQEGYLIYRKPTTGIPKIYRGKDLDMTLEKSDDGTLAVCGYFKSTPCDSSSLKCEVERIIENKRIYLYKQESSSSFIIIMIGGAGVAVIIISMIMTKILCWWKNKSKTNARTEDSSFVTNESLLYSKLQLIESNPNRLRIQENSTPYSTITGVLAP